MNLQNPSTTIPGGRVYASQDVDRPTDAADCPVGIGIRRVGYAIICCVLNSSKLCSGHRDIRYAPSYIGDIAMLKIDTRTPMLARFLVVFSRILNHKNESSCR